MTKYARMDGSTAVEVIDWNPEGRYPEEWVWVECPPETVQGSTKTGNTWSHPDPVSPGAVEPVAPAKRTLVSPVEYFSLFSPLEEFGIRQAAEGATDQAKILAIFLRRLDHPSLTQIDLASAQVQQGLGLLVAMGLVTAERKAEIEQGV